MNSKCAVPSSKRYSKHSSSGAMSTATTFAAIATIANNDNKNRNYIILVQIPLFVRWNYLNDLYKRWNSVKTSTNLIVYVVLMFNANSFLFWQTPSLVSSIHMQVSIHISLAIVTKGETKMIFYDNSVMKCTYTNSFFFFFFHVASSFMTLFITL